MIDDLIGAWEKQWRDADAHPCPNAAD